ncbi:MAG: thioredoxin family protein [Bacteroidetes bacterium]|nr:thioredoxin family protein [Bacteroidota bacterium]
MKSRLFSAIILILTITLPVSAQSIDSVKMIFENHRKYDPSANAEENIQYAVVTAKKLNKRIILDVGGEWCSWCHRLDSLFIRNKDLNDYLNEHYIVVKINVSKENKNEAVLSKYPKISGYPYIFVLNKKGKLVYSQNTEEWEYPKDSPIKGYNKEKVFESLKKWAK